MNGNLGYKSIIVGLAALAIAASCSTAKYASRYDDTANGLKNPDIMENTIDTVIGDKFESIKQDIDKEFCTDSVTFRLVKNVSAYKPKIHMLPEGVKVVGFDTLDFRYTPAGPIDPVRFAKNNEVMKNASRIFPQSRPYLKHIVDACDKYRTIFDVPPELMVAILYCESNGDQYAISHAGARGGWQFMGPTAEGMGMRVNSLEKFSTFYSLEKKIVKLARSYGYYYTATRASLSANNFDMVKRYKLASDSLLKEYKATRAAIVKEAARIGPKNIAKLDETMDIPVSTDNAVELMAGLAKRFKKEFHCTSEQALLWAQEAYNAGYNTVKFNQKPFLETEDYTRKIAFLRAKLYPIYD